MDGITDINDKEKEAVEELRNRLKGDIEDDMYEDVYFFYRFLKDQEFKVNNAEAMIRKHLKWRERKDIKNILNYKKPEVLEKYFPYNILGHDKEGNLVRYCAVGSLDLIGFNNCLKFEEMEKYLIYEVEMDGFYLRKKSKELGRNIDQCIYIQDMENIAFKTVTDKKVVYMMINYVIFCQNNYPERVKAVFFINCSMYFTMLFNIIKKFLKGSVIERIHTYSDDSFKQELLNLIDADVLPAFLGGNKTDPDGNPLCLTFVHRGEPVPEKYYKHKSKKSLASLEGVKKISLSQAAYHEEFLDVKEPGSCLEWEFETKSRDIGFGVFYEDATEGDTKMVELIPHQRIDTEEYAETGTYLCEKPGRYVVLFDNSYSWLRSKEIYYRIRIVTPKEQDSQIKNEIEV